MILTTMFLAVVLLSSMRVILRCVVPRRVMVLRERRPRRFGPVGLLVIWRLRVVMSRLCLRVLPFIVWLSVVSRSLRVLVLSRFSRRPLIPFCPLLVLRWLILFIGVRKMFTLLVRWRVRLGILSVLYVRCPRIRSLLRNSLYTILGCLLTGRSMVLWRTIFRWMMLERRT